MYGAPWPLVWKKYLLTNVKEIEHLKKQVSCRLNDNTLHDNERSTSDPQNGITKIRRWPQTKYFVSTQFCFFFRHFFYSYWNSKKCCFCDKGWSIRPCVLTTVLCFWVISQNYTAYRKNKRLNISLYLRYWYWYRKSDLFRFWYNYRKCLPKIPKYSVLF